MDYKRVLILHSHIVIFSSESYRLSQPIRRQLVSPEKGLQNVSERA